MGKNRSASGITNVIQYDNNGNITFVSGSTTLMQVSSSGAITTTGVISGSNALSASFSLNSALLNDTGSVGFATTGSLLTVSSSQQQISSSLLQVSASQQQLSSSFLTLTASFNAVSASQQQISSSYIALSASYNVFSGSASTRITENSSSIQQVSASQQQISSSQQQISSSLLNVISVFATTGSNSFRATQSITGSLTVTGQIIAQTLNVQQVTSSIIYSSGSNNFGCDLNSRQTFTGSVLITGSLTIAGASSATSYSGTTIYGSTAVCSAVGKFTTCIDAGTGRFSGNDLTLQGGTYPAITAKATATFPIFSLINDAQTAQWNIELGRTVSGNLEFYNSGTKISFTPAGAAAFSSTITGTTIYGSTAVCSPVGKFSSCIDAGSGTFTGGVSIGTTNTTGKVNIQQTINDSGLYFFNCSSGTRFMFNHYCGSGINSLIIQEFDSCNAFCRNIITLASGGNVGIGTASPAGKLDVYAGSYQNLIFKAESANQSSLRFNESTNGPRLYSDAGTEEFRMQQSYTGTGFLTFYTGPNERMRITSGGNLLATGGRISNARCSGGWQEWVAKGLTLTNNSALALFCINGQYDNLIVELAAWVDQGAWSAVSYKYNVGYNAGSSYTAILGPASSICGITAGTTYNETWCWKNCSGNNINNSAIVLRIFGMNAQNSVSNGGADLIISSYLTRIS